MCHTCRTWRLVVLYPTQCVSTPPKNWIFIKFAPWISTSQLLYCHWLLLSVWHVWCMVRMSKYTSTDVTWLVYVALKGWSFTLSHLPSAAERRTEVVKEENKCQERHTWLCSTRWTCSQIIKCSGNVCSTQWGQRSLGQKKNLLQGTHCSLRKK